MTFNGWSETSWTKIKNVDVRNSVVNNFERKIITERGMERASVETPVTRLIEIDFVSTEKTRTAGNSALDNLRAMANAFAGYGISKLVLDDNPGYYYWARAKTFTEPEVIGASAKMTITFECADYNLHSVTDGQTAYSYTGQNNFRFGGKHCLIDYGCVFVEDSRQVVPAVNATKYSITGMNGTYRYAQDAPVLDEWVLEGTLYYVFVNNPGTMMQPAVIRERCRNVASWLINTQRGKLVFDADNFTPSYEFDAEVVSAQEFSTNDWTNGAIKLRMLVQPVCQMSNTESHQFTFENPTPGQVFHGTDIDLSYYGIFKVGYRTPIVLEITNMADTETGDPITGFDLTFPHAGIGTYKQLYHDADEPFSIPPGHTLRIDTENRTIELTDGYEYFVDYSKFPYQNATQYFKFGWPYIYPDGVTADNILRFSMVYGMSSVRIKWSMKRRFVG